MSHPEPCDECEAQGVVYIGTAGDRRPVICTECGGTGWAPWHPSEQSVQEVDPTLQQGLFP